MVKLTYQPSRGGPLVRGCDSAAPCWKEIILKLNVVYFPVAGRYKQSFGNQTLKNMSFVFLSEGRESRENPDGW